jgi:hypothetical protein
VTARHKETLALGFSALKYAICKKMNEYNKKKFGQSWERAEKGKV